MIVPFMSEATIASTLASIIDCRKLRVWTNSSWVRRASVTSRNDSSTALFWLCRRENEQLITIASPPLRCTFTSTLRGKSPRANERISATSWRRSWTSS
jgi:hypothetical protein